MTTKPSAYCRFVASMRGEVRADVLEAYRHAGASVYELVDQIEQERLGHAAEGLTPWSMPLAARLRSACAWNALMLQVMGDRMLDVDYEIDPATAGFVPQVTGDQILSYYSQVEEWVSRANQAGSNPHYELDVDMPAAIPAWSVAEKSP